MPYSLFELTQMSREQLENVAQELQIKNVRKLNDEDLGYEILDAQARKKKKRQAEEIRGAKEAGCSTKERAGH